MQNIGERLEEARKRKGISLREAAEATKIRSDFLGLIEQNKFDFDLPEIYKRGFIKNYARYLKLDPESIIADYSADLLSKSRTGKKGGAELFGTMEVKGGSPEEASSSSSSTSSYGRISSTPAPKETEKEEANAEDDSDKIFYIKAGLVAVGTLALVFVIFGLIKAILSSDAEPETTEPIDPPAITESIESATPAVGADSISLIASGNVYVLVKQRNDNQELYRKTMSGGETVTLTKSGPVDILFTAGENLVIDHAGERLRPSSSGTAKISIP